MGVTERSPREGMVQSALPCPHILLWETRELVHYIVILSSEVGSYSVYKCDIVCRLPIYTNLYIHYT